MSDSEATLRGEPVGVVLAGGQSRRMGRDKTRLTLPWLDGLSLLEWAAQRLSRVCSEWVVADAGKGRWSSERSVLDGDGKGPVAGILGAADRFPGRDLLVLACDLPLVSPFLLSRLISHPGDWVAPVTSQGPEPLCALYGVVAVRQLRLRVARNQFSLKGLADDRSGLQICFLAAQDLVGELSRMDKAMDVPPEVLFANLNRPEDVELLISDDAALRHFRFLRLNSTRG